MGRPTDLTPERARIICEALGKGHTRRCAAALAGVSERTLFRWFRWGKQRKEPYCQLWQLARLAEAKAEVAIIDKIKEIGDAGTWQALAWIAERRWPEEWATNRSEMLRLLKQIVGKGKTPEAASR